MYPIIAFLLAIVTTPIWLPMVVAYREYIAKDL